jgi:hypothetical protein
MRAETGSRQTGVGVPSADGVAVCFAVRVAKSTVHFLILCVMLGFWISSEGASAVRPECAGACGVQSRASVAGVQVANGRRLTDGWAEGFPLSNAMLASGGNGILESAGVALFVSGLSPYLLQGMPQQPDNDARPGEPVEYPRAGRRRQFPLHLEFLAWLFFFGFVSWGGTVWMERH